MTANLVAALKSLRDELEANFWWIDYLCNNHDDSEERALQVLCMTTIYRNASKVLAWIGSEKPGQSIFNTTLIFRRIFFNLIRK
jgi:hypothetical protein